MTPDTAAYLRLRIDAGQEPVDIENDIDVYVSLPGGDQDNLEPQLQFRFTDEGLVIDVFVDGACVGTSSETYGEIHERLSDDN